MLQSASTKWGRVVLENLVFVQLVKKGLYGTQRLIPSLKDLDTGIILSQLNPTRILF
jgi:hypothetical protein